MAVMRVVRIVSGVILLAVCGIGSVHGVKAAVAQIGYHHAKFGRKVESPEALSGKCRTASMLYPYNFYFPLWAAENAYLGRFNADGTLNRNRIATAIEWCDDGLRLNRWRISLRLLKTRLMAINSPAEAAGYWKEYVEWHFWDHYNHAVLAELYAESGDFDKALDELTWTRGSAHYASASRAIQKAWEAEMLMPQDNVDSTGTPLTPASAEEADPSALQPRPSGMR